MKTYCHWLGTDSLTLITDPPGKRLWHLKLKLYRMKWRYLHPKFTEHWAVASHIKRELVKFGIPEHRIKIKPNPPKIVVPRKLHKGFNILYYKPKPSNLGGVKYRDWLYGIDIIEKLKKLFAMWEVTWIEVDGSQDMTEIYPIVDIMIRPTRHDGAPRMVSECQAMKIPYYYNKDFAHNIGYIQQRIINQIYEQVQSKPIDY